MGVGAACSSVTAALVVMAQPALATTAKIQDVQVVPGGNGVSIVLKTEGGEQVQVFSAQRGNAWVADLTNTQLASGNFRKDQPTPGISAVTLQTLDSNSVRLEVQGAGGSLTGRMASKADGQLAFAVQPGPLAQAAPVAPAKKPATLAQAAPPPMSAPAPMPPGPPLMRRAVPPPVGDISISQIELTASTINLGPKGNTRIPRLVLRNAPIREILSVLARTAGVNMIYVPPGTKTTSSITNLTETASGFQLQTFDKVESESFTEGDREGGSADPLNLFRMTLSLDIENETVQNVLNYVLRVANLEANVDGNTIIVGRQLPQKARNLVTRSLRMNQTTALDAGSFLVTQGAEAQFIEQQAPEINTTTVNGISTITQTTQPPTVTRVAPTQSSGPLPLLGMTVTADARTNIVTMTGTPDKISIATTLLQQIDARKRQVLVNVKVIDFILSNSNTSSFGFSFGSGNTFFDFRTPGNMVIDFTRGLGGLPTSFAGTLRAQIESGNAKVLTDPTLLIQEGQVSSVRLTQQIVSRLVVETTGGATVPIVTTEPELAEVGLVINVGVDRIDDNGFINLRVLPDISAPGTEIPLGVSNGIRQFVTPINRRATDSGLIRLRDGQTLVLAGIIQDGERNSVTKVPLLGDIPLLGALFRSNSKTNERNEVVVVLTPQIIDDTTPASFGYTPPPNAGAMMTPRP
ncbi:MAG: AMIN domain-containing protein [Gloeomargaritaceae cyanobacterium C42_A2020_066]|nr:AMIN domain-containing protein [Gloeomargaritaceae cyanobacterium C42_A2020_066]